MIDIHSHIVPGVDDGSKDIDISLEMLRSAEESGTKKIVLTPHYFPGKFDLKYKKIESEFFQLKEIVEKEKINIELYLGQEVYFTKYIIDQLEAGDIKTINNSRYMLIEFNMKTIEKDTLEIMHELIIRKIVPIIAHPERYMDFQKKPSLINEYLSIGCLFQLNVNSLSGLLGKESKKLAELYLKENIYSFLGSDAHGIGKRNTNLNQYISIVNEKNNDFINCSIKNGIKLLNNESIEPCKTRIKKEKKGILSLFSRN